MRPAGGEGGRSGEVYSRQREQQVQRPCGWKKLGLFKEQKEGPEAWGRENKGERLGDGSRKVSRARSVRTSGQQQEQLASWCCHLGALFYALSHLPNSFNPRNSPWREALIIPI